MPQSQKPKRKHRPLPTSAPVRERAIDALDKLYTRLMLGSKATRTVGEGERRARKLLAAKRKANAGIPSGEQVTRQRLRQDQRLRDRQLITVAKAEIAKLRKSETPMGGSAIIRSVDDIHRILG
jgi:hypothetical protein